MSDSSGKLTRGHSRSFGIALSILVLGAFPGEKSAPSAALATRTATEPSAIQSAQTQTADAAQQRIDYSNRTVPRFDDQQLVELLWEGAVVLQTTWAGLGMTLNADETERRLALQPKQPKQRTESDDAPRPALRPVLHVDYDVFERVLVPLKEALDVANTAPRYDWAQRLVIAGRPGRFVDLDATWAVLWEAATTGTARVPLVQAELPLSPASNSIAVFEPKEIVSKFQTRFKRGGVDASRARNIEVAASRLNGLILLPNQLMSFNEVVGQRSLENGFQKSFEIYKGEMVPGVGGGTCQVSSTLHAAAFQAGLEVVDRFPHSRVLGYIPVGFDSTVAWPAVDLKLRNPWPFPVVIQATVEGNELSVSVLGERKPAKVHIERRTLEVLPYGRSVEVKRYYEPHRIKQKQKGVLGYRVLLVRRVAAPDGTVKWDRRVDFYPPAAELFHVGREVDIDADLPPLPEMPARDEQRNAPKAQRKRFTGQG